jgi:hypothetical protein
MATSKFFLMDIFNWPIKKIQIVDNPKIDTNVELKAKDMG